MPTVSRGWWEQLWQRLYVCWPLVMTEQCSRDDAFMTMFIEKWESIICSFQMITFVSGTSLWVRQWEPWGGRRVHDPSAHVFSDHRATGLLLLAPAGPGSRLAFCFWPCPELLTLTFSSFSVFSGPGIRGTWAVLPMPHPDPWTEPLCLKATGSQKPGPPKGPGSTSPVGSEGSWICLSRGHTQGWNLLPGWQPAQLRLELSITWQALRVSPMFHLSPTEALAMASNWCLRFITTCVTLHYNC